jgi:outer membrane protein OmpA-like peptidoglycan-associated protein
MYKPHSIYLLLCFGISLLLFSCVPQKKIPSVKKDLAAIDSQLVVHSNQLKELDAKRQAKEDKNEIDDTTNSRIQKFINKTNAEIDTLIKKNTILIADVAVDKNDWNRLLKALSVSRVSSQKIGDRISFLNDLISRNMVVKIDQDVLFEPGKYTVAPEMANTIGKLFEPAVKEIDLFTRKYPDFPLSLVITAKGYADATAIAEGSPLYKDLKDRLKLENANPDLKDLNKELSTARAFEVKELFKKFSAGRSADGSNLKNVVYLYEGKGEKFPDPKITDYTADDARRRVVLLFWSVFPD